MLRVGPTMELLYGDDIPPARSMQSESDEKKTQKNARVSPPAS